MRFGARVVMVLPFLFMLPRRMATFSLTTTMRRRLTTTTMKDYTSTFPERHFHLGLAHLLWQQFVRPGDIIVDATCGNGLDSVVLAKLCFDPASRKKGHLHCMDIQDRAIERTKAALRADGSFDEETLAQNVHYHCQNFTSFPSPLGEEGYKAKLVVYNLGYLPLGDKAITTTTEDTLESISKVVGEGGILAHHGLLSVMCYAGHEEGVRETRAIQDYLSQLGMNDWRVFTHSPSNRPGSPVLITALRLENPPKKKR